MVVAPPPGQAGDSDGPSSDPASTTPSDTTWRAQPPARAQAPAATKTTTATPFTTATSLRRLRRQRVVLDARAHVPELERQRQLVGRHGDRCVAAGRERARAGLVRVVAGRLVDVEVVEDDAATLLRGGHPERSVEGVLLHAVGVAVEPARGAGV